MTARIIDGKAVAAELRGTKASMNDLMHLVPGDVLQLDNRVGQPVAVSVGGVVCEPEVTVHE